MEKKSFFLFSLVVVFYICTNEPHCSEIGKFNTNFVREQVRFLMASCKSSDCPSTKQITKRTDSSNPDNRNFHKKAMRFFSNLLKDRAVMFGLFRENYFPNGVKKEVLNVKNHEK